MPCYGIPCVGVLAGGYRRVRLVRGISRRGRGRGREEEEEDKMLRKITLIKALPCVLAPPSPPPPPPRILISLYPRTCHVKVLLTLLAYPLPSFLLVEGRKGRAMPNLCDGTQRTSKSSGPCLDKHGQGVAKMERNNVKPYTTFFLQLSLLMCRKVVAQSPT